MSSLRPYSRSKNQPSWLFQYKDLQTGKWKQRVLNCTKEQAYHFKRQFDADFNYLKLHPEEIKTNISLITLNLAKKRFLKLKSVDKAPETIRKYKNILDHFTDMLGNTYAVRNIDNSTIEQFKLYYFDNHSKTGTNMALRHLKAFCYWCYDKEYLPRKPKFEMLKTVRKDVRWLTKDEYQQLYTLVPQELKDVMTLCISTGARIREVLMRPWTDFKLDEKVIILDAHVVKGRYQSALYMNDKCIDVLKRIREEKPKGKHPFPYNYDYIHNRYDTACRKAGIQSSTHDWRRSAGAWLLQEGVSIYHVSRFLRHSSTRVTEEHYADLVKENYSNLSDHIQSILS
jgi:integrase